MMTFNALHRIATATALLTVLPPFASAESTAEALKITGLVGAWSPNCETDSMRDVYGIMFNVPFIGTPTWSERNGKITLPIVSTTRVTDEKIKVVRGGPQELEFLFLKIGPKIKLVSAKSLDGKTIRAKDGYYYSENLKDNPTYTPAPTPLLEKCLN